MKQTVCDLCGIVGVPDDYMVIVVPTGLTPGHIAPVSLDVCGVCAKKILQISATTGWKTV